MRSKSNVTVVIFIAGVVVAIAASALSDGSWLGRIVIMVPILLVVAGLSAMLKARQKGKDNSS
jgi:hypothetical protein